MLLLFVTEVFPYVREAKRLSIRKEDTTVGGSQTLFSSSFSFLRYPVAFAALGPRCLVSLTRCCTARRTTHNDVFARALSPALCISRCPYIFVAISLSLCLSASPVFHRLLSLSPPLNISISQYLPSTVLFLCPFHPSLNPPNICLQEVDTTGGASDPSGTGKCGEERSFIDAGFHALATDAVEGQEEGDAASPSAGQKLTSRNADDTNGNGHDRSAMMRSIDGAAAAVAAVAAEAASSGRTTHKMSRGGETAAATGDNANDTQGEIGSVRGQGEDEEEDEEDFGSVELVVTQDGGIIPVAAATVVGDSSAAGAVLASETSQTMGRGVHNDGVKVAVDGNDGGASAIGNVRSAVTEGGIMNEEEEDEDDGKEEEETPLPPDIVLTLADDALHRTMLFLHPEEIFECRAVSSRWDFPGHEEVFEGLCRRTYLAQVCLRACGRLFCSLPGHRTRNTLPRFLCQCSLLIAQAIGRHLLVLNV